MTDTIKMTAPENSGPFERNGITYEIGADGCVSVPGDIVNDLSDHGFLAVPDAPVDPATDPSFVPSEDIRTMNRNELFAYIKAKGVVVSPPITNDELRRIAMGPVRLPSSEQSASVIQIAPIQAGAPTLLPTTATPAATN